MMVDRVEGNIVKETGEPADGTGNAAAPLRVDLVIKGRGDHEEDFL